jgi:exodeoxyribonuclease V gamma subunit
VTLEGAQALTGARSARPPFLAEPLAPRERGPVELEDLVKFVERPVRAFLRQRLGISVGDYTHEVADALPVELDNLALWNVGERLLAALMAGADGRSAIRAEIARGSLPPGQLGRPVVDKIWSDVDGIAKAAQKIVRGEPRSVDVKIEVGGRRLTGTVPGVRGSVLTTITFSRVSARHRLAAWVRLLALAATGGAFSAATIGRGSSDEPVAVVRLPELDHAVAVQQLELLLDLYDRGMCEPLPLACRTSAAYAAGMNARNEWESDRFPKENRDPEHELVWGQLAFAELLTDAPRPDERWFDDEPSRFGQYAKRLWSGPREYEA